MTRANGPVWQHVSTVPAEPLTGCTTCDVAVVGAGIVGLTTALELARSGRDVVVLEARHIGAGTTGSSTAKVSTLQGTRVSGLAERHPPQVLARYVEAQVVGHRWITQMVHAGGVDAQIRDTITYAATPVGAQAVAREAEAMAVAGLPVAVVDAVPEARWPVIRAVRLPDQLQIDPHAYLAALLTAARAAGVRVFDGTRADGLAPGAGSRVLGCSSEAGRGRVRARHVVLAGGAPLFDRSGLFARVEPERSSTIAVRARGNLPEPMFLSADSPTRSIRTVGRDDLVLIGGNAYPVGRARSTARALTDLEDWARAHLDVVEVTHRWAAQDYHSADGLPLVGRHAPRSRDVLVATGFAKWGMTGGTAAALAVAGEIIGRPVPWARDWDPWRTGRGAPGPTAALNAGVAREMVGGWVRGLATAGDAAADLHEGQGLVVRSGVRPTAVSRVDGRVRAVSAVCPHLGGILRWNDAETSWDCPLHGSRFDADGRMLEGPARCGLARR